MIVQLEELHVESLSLVYPLKIIEAPRNFSRAEELKPPKKSFRDSILKKLKLS